jgi:outer membrane protein assembly factor BamD
MLSPDRDQTATINALSTFSTLLARFPSHPQKDEITDLMARCRQQLAAHELGVGTFYTRTEYYAAAIARLAPIPNDYPEYAGMDEVYYQLGRAYLGQGEKRKAAETFNRMYKEFPNSKFILKAQKLLEEEF